MKKKLVTNPKIAVHDRMLILKSRQLRPVARPRHDGCGSSDLLKPCDARLMRCYPVSIEFNSVANDDEECSRPVEFAPTQNRLFS
jgi:putative SOS response-associated peptidase YedK